MIDTTFFVEYGDNGSGDVAAAEMINGQKDGKSERQNVFFDLRTSDFRTQ